MNKSVLAMAGAVVLLAACSRPAPPQEPIRAVKVMTVGGSALSMRHEYAGEVRARVESRLGFRIGGKIIKRQAELGQHVKAGDVLAQLDPQDYRLAADAARAQVAAAATQRDLAAADFGRYKTLKDQNFISGAELQRREATLKAAQAQLDQAKSQAAVQGNQTGYAVLTADVSGVITAIDAEPGQVVTAGTPVLRIAADGVRDVVFSVPEDKVAAIKPGMPVSLQVWGQAAGQPDLAGRVREVAASSDPITRTYLVKVAVEAAQAPPLGATVTVVMPLAVPPGGATSVLKLPTSALRQEGQSTAVWVLDKATMTLRSQIIQIATADGNEAVVVAGLEPGMLVVSAGVHVLSPGQKVTLYQSKTGFDQSIRAQNAPELIASPAAGGASASASLAASAPASLAASAAK